MKRFQRVEEKVEAGPGVRPVAAAVEKPMPRAPRAGHVRSQTPMRRGSRARPQRSPVGTEAALSSAQLAAQSRAGRPPRQWAERRARSCDRGAGPRGAEPRPSEPFRTEGRRPPGTGEL